jgi:hypothetical protein
MMPYIFQLMPQIPERTVGIIGTALITGCGIRQIWVQVLGLLMLSYAAVTMNPS